MKVVIEKVSPEQNAYATVKQPQNASVIYVDVCIVYLQNVRTLKLPTTLFRIIYRRCYTFTIY